ncbi:AIG1 family protein [Durusdinium trenchii]|uniref:AIG1 family protein n=1 Tax=Durusdinium trenchii TaxID=1381693 RepID=A0ABP0QWU5_9DINO
MNARNGVREHQVRVVNLGEKYKSRRLSLLPESMFGKKDKEEFDSLLRVDETGLLLVVFGRSPLKKMADAINRRSLKPKKLAKIEEIVDFGLDPKSEDQREGKWWVRVKREEDDKERKYEFQSRSVFQAVGWLQSFRKLRGEREIPVVAVLGETGVGKSLLASRLAGLKEENSVFRVDKTLKSVTSTTDMYLTHWLGQEGGGEVVIVDTPGLSDSQGRDDANVADMLTKLGDLGGVHTFVVLFNSQDPRLRGPLEQMLSVFERKFREGFWEHSMIVFTRWYNDPISRQRRPKSEEEMEHEWNAELQERFPAIGKMRRTDKSLPCFFVDNAPLDAETEESNNNELRRFSVTARQNEEFDCRHTIPDQGSVDALFKKVNIPPEAQELAEFLRVRSLLDRLQGLVLAGVTTLNDFTQIRDHHLSRHFGWTDEELDRLHQIHDRSTPNAPNFVVINEFQALGIPTEGLEASGLGASELLALSNEDVMRELNIKFNDLLKFFRWRARILQDQPVQLSTINPGSVVVRDPSTWKWDVKGEVPDDWNGPGVVLNYRDMNGTVHGTSKAPRGWKGNPKAFDAPQPNGWARVYWVASGISNVYRVGAENREDLRYTDPADHGLENIKPENPVASDFPVPDFAKLSPQHLRCTFGFSKGLVPHPHWARFDTRPEVCQRVGGQKHGDVVLVEGHRCTCIGASITREGNVGLYFALENKPGSGLLDGDLSFTVVGSERVSQIPFSDMDCSVDKPHTNADLAAIIADYKDDFDFAIGRQFKVPGKFDRRDVQLARMGYGLKHGDEISYNAGQQGHVRFTVVGVSMHESEIPRLWLYKENAPGATCWVGMQEDYPGMFTMLGNRGQLSPIVVPPNTFSPPSDSELRAMRLRPTFEFPVGVSGQGNMSFDIRPEICGRLCGMSPGTVVSLQTDEGEVVFTIIGVLQNPENGIPTVWLHQEGHRGATIIPQLIELLPSFQVADERRDLEELREEVARMPSGLDLLFRLLGASSAAAVSDDPSDDPPPEEDEFEAFLHGR